MLSLRQSLSILFLFITSASFAQVSSIAPEQTFAQPGTFELGGSISFSSQKYDNSTSSTSTFSINPFVGCFATKGFELGISPGFSFQTSLGDRHTRSFNFLFEPAYNFTLSGSVYPYVEAIAGYTFRHTDDELPFENRISTDEGYAVGGEVGFKGVIRRNALILFSIQYLQQKYKTDATYYYSAGETSFSTLSAQIGFRIYIESGHSKK